MQEIEDEWCVKCGTHCVEFDGVYITETEDLFMCYFCVESEEEVKQKER